MIPFLVQVGGIALAAGLAASLIGWFFVRCSRWLSASRRADVVVVAGALPVVVCAGLAAAMIVPTALDVLGFQPDHCHAHDHGLHLCGVHGDVYPPLFVMGGALFAVLAGRVMVVAVRLWRTSVAVQRLTAFGTRVGSVVEVPSEAVLCHAAGALRPRVLLSSAVRERLGSPAIEAALAHEEAHLRRRDPLALAFLQLAGVFGVPGLGFVSAFRNAADEAADAEAAAEVGALAVADALVRMARLMRERPRTLSASTLAFGAHALEQRVVRLLSGPMATKAARGLLWSCGMAVVVLALGTFGAESIHHVVEDFLLAHH